ncbi:hypothetical protein LMH81_31505, partial [Vibrio lentus]
EVKGQKYEDDSSEGIFKRYVMTAITNDLWGMTKDTVDGVKRTYPDLAELFTRAGYSTLGKDFSNAKGRQVVANM